MILLVILLMLDLTYHLIIYNLLLNHYLFVFYVHLYFKMLLPYLESIFFYLHYSFISVMIAQKPSSVIYIHLYHSYDYTRAYFIPSSFVFLSLIWLHLSILPSIYFHLLSMLYMSILLILFFTLTLLLTLSLIWLHYSQFHSICIYFLSLIWMPTT